MRNTVKSSIPAGCLPNGMTIPLTQSEEAVVTQALKDIGEKRVMRALSAYMVDKAQKPKPKPFVYHICPNPTERGISPVAVQLLNTTSFTAFTFFERLVRRVFPQPTA